MTQDVNMPPSNSEVLRQLGELRQDIRDEHEERRAFRAQLNRRLDRDDERADRIEEQVKATNGRVTKLELAAAEIRGGVRVVSVAAGPIAKRIVPVAVLILGIAIGRAQLITQALEALGLMQ